MFGLILIKPVSHSLISFPVVVKRRVRQHLERSIRFCFSLSLSLFCGNKERIKRFCSLADVIGYYCRSASHSNEKGKWTEVKRQLGNSPIFIVISDFSPLRDTILGGGAAFEKRLLGSYIIPRIRQAPALPPEEVYWLL
eukprot:gene11832-8141_t